MGICDDMSKLFAIKGNLPNHANKVKKDAGLFEIRGKKKYV